MLVENVVACSLPSPPTAVFSVSGAFEFLPGDGQSTGGAAGKLRSTSWKGTGREELCSLHSNTGGGGLGCPWVVGERWGRCHVLMRKAGHVLLSMLVQNLPRLNPLGQWRERRRLCFKRNCLMGLWQHWDDEWGTPWEVALLQFSACFS